MRLATLLRLVAIAVALSVPQTASANHTSPEMTLGGTIEASFSSGQFVSQYCAQRNAYATWMIYRRVTGTGKHMTVSSHYADQDVVLWAWENEGAHATMGCEDDVEDGLNARVTFPSVAGRSYLVGVGKRCSAANCTTWPDNSGGTFFNAFDNDARASARISSFGSAVEWTNAGAGDAGDALDCEGTTIADGVWFRYDAASHGTATFHLQSQVGKLSLHVFRPDGSLVDCAVWSGLATNLRINSVSGPGDYVVQVGASISGSGAEGGTNFTLHTEFAPNYDLDNDGVNGTPGGDCNDANPSIRPGIPELLGNEVDENCDTIREHDADRDSARVFKTAAGALEGRPGADCDDGDPQRFPGNPEIVGNRKDENCDGADTPFPRITSTILHDFLVYRRSGYMTVASLRIQGLVLGSKVVLRCSRPAGARKPKRGRGCPFKRRTVSTSAKSTKLALTRQLAGHKLARELNIDVDITRAGMVGRTKRIWLPRRGSVVQSRYGCLHPATGARYRCS